MDLVKREDVLEIVKDCKERSKIKNLPHYNPVSKMDKLKAELSEILQGYEKKKEPMKVKIDAKTCSANDFLDALRYVQARNKAPMYIKPTEYPIRKYKVVAKENWGLADHYVYADDVSEDENGCYFWIEDKCVGHFYNAVAYYEVKEDESDINRE